jgi:putative serine protease PepD
VCGGALILGSCAMHPAPKPPATTAPAAAALPPAAVVNTKVDPKLPWPTVAMIVLLLVLTGGLGLVWSTTSRIESDQRAAIAEQDELIGTLRNQVLAQQQIVDGANGRLAALEAKTGGQVDAAAVAAQVQPSVWTIETPGGVGSGFFLGKGGVTRHLVTNYHVVADVWETGGRKVMVRRDNGQQMEGTIERVHEYTDLALVAVAFDQPPLRRGPDLPKPGDSVVAVGSPLGLGGSVSSGIVSAIRTDGGESLIQFTAAVSPGSSGGPVVNAKGEVIAVTVAKAVELGAEGVSFAIPVSDICTALEYCD